jgi:hypothetical protein
LDRYTPRGLLWLVIVIITVGGMAIAEAIGLTASFFESELPDAWKVVVALVVGSVMVVALALSTRSILKARKLSHYCSECAAIITAKEISRPEEYGAHKVRLKKE